MRPAAHQPLHAFCAEYQIAIEAWSPLARGQVLGDPAVESIARRTGKTPAQVVLRWHIERGAPGAGLRQSCRTSPGLTARAPPSGHDAADQ
jgi:diketogulonate reductase-like aldo/keto reductase